MAEQAPLRACLAVIRLLAALVPPPRRDDWRREWEGELRHRWSRLHARGAIGWGERLDLARRALGAVPDAAWLRRQFTLDSELAHDAAYGLRLMRSAPGFAAAVVLILAVALGSAGALYAIADALFVRPLPFREPERLVTVWQSNPRERIDRDDVAPGNFLDWRERCRSFETLAAAVPYSYDWAGPSEPEAWPAVQVTEGFFDAVGTRPLLGRTFRTDEHTRGNERVIVLSHPLWKKRFGGDPAALGRIVIFDEGPYTVVGVMGPGFDLGLLPRLGGRGLWTPHVVAEHERRTRGSGWWQVLGRLKSGVTVDQARAEMDVVARALADEYPRTNVEVGFPVLSLREHLVAGLRPALAALAGGVALLLAISLFNVAGLLLARGEAREREFALRASLGAGRARLVRQLLAENALLVLAAGAAGAVLARAGMPVLLRMSPVHIARAEAIRFDGRALGFMLALSLATLAFCSLLPALRLVRARLGSATRVGRVLGASPLRTRRALVVAQLGLALTLLAGSGLLARSVAALLAVDPGFQKNNLLALQVFAWDRNPSAAQRQQFFAEAQRRIAAVPGVDRVGAVSMMPFTEDAIDIRSPLLVEGRPAPEAGQEPRVYLSIATPGYFECMRIPLRRGRLFEERDGPSSTPVALINQTLEERLFRGEDPIGRKVALRWDGRPVLAEIVGVVGSVRQARLERSAAPEVYLPHSQVPFASMTFVVRTRAEPASLLRDAQRAVWSLDPRQTFARTAVVEDLVERTLADRLFLSFVSGAFALIALGLSAVGTYGLLSFLVARRAGEIGLRMALGARAPDVLKLVLGEAGALILAGLSLGLLGTLLLGRMLESWLFGITPADPRTMASVAVAVTAAGLLAAYAPARRAVRLDPARTLRAE